MYVYAFFHCPATTTGTCGASEKKEKAADEARYRSSMYRLIAASPCDRITAHFFPSSLPPPSSINPCTGIKFQHIHVHCTICVELVVTIYLIQSISTPIFLLLDHSHLSVFVYEHRWRVGQSLIRQLYFLFFIFCEHQLSLFVLMMKMMISYELKKKVK